MKEWNFRLTRLTDASWRAARDRILLDDFLRRMAKGDKSQNAVFIDICYETGVSLTMLRNTLNRHGIAVEKRKWTKKSL